MSTAQQTDMKILPLIRLSDVKADPKVSRASEAGYRRGVSHGLEVAWTLMQRCDSYQRFKVELAEACDVSMEFRSDHKEHPTLTRDILLRAKGTKDNG
jgi:hypothetical protein